MQRMALAKIAMFLRHARADTSGYTLLELLVVMAIVAMIATMVPAIYSRVFPPVKAREFSLTLSDTLRNLRVSAIENHKTVRVEFVDSSHLRLAGGLLETPDSVFVSVDDSENWQLERVNYIDFYSSGASSGGQIEVYAGNSRLIVYVDWLSGAVSVQ